MTQHGLITWLVEGIPAYLGLGNASPDLRQLAVLITAAIVLGVTISRERGATVAERLARSPPTKANRVQSPAGSPDSRKWESCRTMPLVGGSSRGSPASPAPSFRRRSISTSITFIGSQDPDVKSRPNILTHSHSREGLARRDERGRGSGRSPRKPADQRHRPARFPHAKIRFALVGGERANRSATVAPKLQIDFIAVGRGERYIPEETRRPAAGVTRPGIEPGSPWRFNVCSLDLRSYDPPCRTKQPIARLTETLLVSFRAAGSNKFCLGAADNQQAASARFPEKTRRPAESSGSIPTWYIGGGIRTLRPPSHRGPSSLEEGGPCVPGSRRNNVNCSGASNLVTLQLRPIISGTRARRIPQYRTKWRSSGNVLNSHSKGPWLDSWGPAILISVFQLSSKITPNERWFLNGLGSFFPDPVVEKTLNHTYLVSSSLACLYLPASLQKKALTTYYQISPRPAPKSIRAAARELNCTRAPSADCLDFLSSPPPSPLIPSHEAASNAGCAFPLCGCGHNFTIQPPSHVLRTTPSAPPVRNQTPTTPLPRAKTTQPAISL
ncbi:hypothetical protein PR048_033370 [Dryococelus australis]|uniref:Uncharacterized protein n=1 Tax=Dryococelus australis TaxID=614101 RepID=A0ABQ9G112_9NEOP|nr:hypothetical protein PR048_033370 [Dryococelus australis]